MFFTREGISSLARYIHLMVPKIRFELILIEMKQVYLVASSRSAIWAYSIYKPKNNLDMKINPKIKMINKINPLKACQIKLNINWINLFFHICLAHLQAIEFLFVLFCNLKYFSNIDNF